MQDLVKLIGGDGAAGVLECGSGSVLKQVEGVFAGEAQVVVALELEEPILVAVFLPGSDVVHIEVFGGLADDLDDLGIGHTVEDHLIYLVADDLWEAGDFAYAAMGR